LLKNEQTNNTVRIHLAFHSTPQCGHIVKFDKFYYRGFKNKDKTNKYSTLAGAKKTPTHAASSLRPPLTEKKKTNKNKQTIQ
jgi:hypothetical protein